MHIVGIRVVADVACFQVRAIADQRAAQEILRWRQVACRLADVGQAIRARIDALVMADGKHVDQQDFRIAAQATAQFAIEGADHGIDERLGIGILAQARWRTGHVRQVC